MKSFRFIKNSLILTILLYVVLGFFCMTFFRHTSMVKSHDASGVEKIASSAIKNCCTGDMPNHTMYSKNIIFVENLTHVIKIAPTSYNFILSLFLLGLFVFLNNILLRFYLYLKNKIHLDIFEPLKEYLLKGLLHPKLY